MAAKDSAEGKRRGCCVLGKSLNWIQFLDSRKVRRERLVSGSAEGIFYGGCLPMLAATLGTRHEIPDRAGSILFLEDIGSKPYQIDRMLMQLQTGRQIRRCSRIIFGEMNDCVPARPARVHSGKM